RADGESEGRQHRGRPAWATTKESESDAGVREPAVHALPARQKRAINDSRRTGSFARSRLRCVSKLGSPAQPRDDSRSRCLAEVANTALPRPGAAASLQITATCRAQDRVPNTSLRGAKHLVPGGPSGRRLAPRGSLHRGTVLRDVLLDGFVLELEV